MCEDTFNLTCIEVNSWSEVNNVLGSNKCKNAPYSIFLYPNAPLTLSNELNISAVAFANQIESSVVNSIYLSGIEGIEIYPWHACTSCVRNRLSISLSSIKFYVNKQPPGSYNCTPDLVPDNSATSVSFFSQKIEIIFLNYGNTYGRLSKAICPYVFKNAHIPRGLQLFYQVDSFLFVSLLQFQTDDLLLNKTRKLSINSYITNLLFFNGYNFKLNTGILHPVVFEQISYLLCLPKYYSIDSNGHF
jgi:hypothetical protein